MDQDEPGRNSPQSGGQRPVSTVRSYSRLRSYTGHGNLTCLQRIVLRLRPMWPEAFLCFCPVCQRWKWVIFRDPWPMAFTLGYFNLLMGLGGNVAWWYWTTLSVLGANKMWIKIKPPTMIDNRTRPNEWVSSFLASTKNKKLHVTGHLCHYHGLMGQRQTDSYDPRSPGLHRWWPLKMKQARLAWTSE